MKARHLLQCQILVPALLGDLQGPPTFISKMSASNPVVRRTSDPVTSNIPPRGRSVHRFHRITAVEASLLAQNGDVCEICLENYSAREDLVRRSCCQLLTHVSCLALWASLVPEGKNSSFEGGSRLPHSFSCPKCRQEVVSDQYFQVAGAAMTGIAEIEAGKQVSDQENTIDDIDARRAQSSSATRLLLRLFHPGRRMRAIRQTSRSLRKRCQQASTRHLTEASALPPS